jgi:hypothetical protein
MDHPSRPPTPLAIAPSAEAGGRDRALCCEPAVAVPRCEGLGSVEFRVEVLSDAGYPLFVRGSFNKLARALSYTLIHRSVGRIYALDMGKDHHNPNCSNVGEKHKHKYTEQYRDKDAYVPHDITAPVDDPVTVWKQFCVEASIDHTGTLHAPPLVQDEMFL